MKIPQTPPSFEKLVREVRETRKEDFFFTVLNAPPSDQEYWHWDDLRHRPAPEGLSHREWWLAIKIRRNLIPIGLKDRKGALFQYMMHPVLLEAVHHIDQEIGGRVVSVPEPITNTQTRDQYLVSSLIEEAITSSQLEGAVTTREVAKEMIRSGRKPRDTSERMILNNYLTMQQIRGLKESRLTPELVFEIHRRVTEGTLENPACAGRFRLPEENIVVGDEEGQIFHDPPDAAELPKRLEAMCAFANGEAPQGFIHPVVRAIVLHFWLAYDHPFVDGNGRTARALFYWAMLRQGYWLFEFLSISSILRKAPVPYGRAFLLTETDDNDLTYFLVSQTEVILKAGRALHAYIERKAGEMRQVESQMRALGVFNHRQHAIVQRALKHPGQQFTFASHQKSHDISRQTARTDLLELRDRGLLQMNKRGKALVFEAQPNLAELIARIR